MRAAICDRVQKARPSMGTMEIARTASERPCMRIAIKRPCRVREMIAPEARLSPGHSTTAPE